MKFDVLYKESAISFYVKKHTYNTAKVQKYPIFLTANVTGYIPNIFSQV